MIACSPTETHQCHIQTNTHEERGDIEDLISSFDNHGCGIGLDVKAQIALRRLLDALDQAEEIIASYSKSQE